MPSQKTVRLAAAQIQSAKTRVANRLVKDPVKRNEHFQKYNISASTYDERYVKAYGEEYLGYLERHVRKAAARRADLLLMPEFCFVPGVLAPCHPSIKPNPNARADAVRLYTWSGELFTALLCRQARATGMFIGTAVYTVRQGKIYNTGLLADDRGRLVLRYEKIHLPCDEKLTVAFGRDYTVADTRLGRIGFAICYDLAYPEHMACLAMRGVQIVLHPSGGYTLPDEGRDMGQNRLRVRASDHYCALVYACFSPDIYESSVIAPNGDVIACVRGNGVGLAVGDVTIGRPRTWPGAGSDGTDWDVVKRQHRRPQTYRLLLKKTVLP